MLLAVDIGNTRTHGGLFRGQTCVKTFSLETPQHSYMPLPSWLRASVCDAVAFASVRPSAERVFCAAIRKRLDVLPQKLGRDIPIPMAIKTDRPREVGTDRLANALAAVAHFPHQPCIVVDLGTAITFDVVSPKGEFLGGVIAPGLGLQAKALGDACALLPEVRLAKKPLRTLGKNTATNIQSGIYDGIAGLIERVVRNIKRELGWRRALVIGTGGDAPLFKQFFYCVIPTLTLEGIAVAYYEVTNGE